ncbi:tRNA-uridine aminocarboxypropyltransferase [Neptunicella sp. SCSIO 80796]|uniref:tRNA-uridine aminocarboxypropyltransferase n=1 Tax=Neptunicella plasticusilytica TaxID=3117012 RepID=UPI003A4E4E79
MSKRQYCPKCLFPQSVCLCDALEPVDNKTNIVVLQHPSELKESKNTVRLMALVLRHCEVFVGETETDFAHIRQRCETQKIRSAVLYPNEKSVELESLNTETPVINHLILLDGTWKKTYKLWQLNPWLHNLPSWHFTKPSASIYQRKTNFQHSLSSLEACAYALNLIEHKNTDSLLQLLKTRQDRGF